MLSVCDISQSVVNWNFSPHTDADGDKASIAHLLAQQADQLLHNKP
jgi:hypothetical protein